jgi:hypothetical protein
MLAKFRGFAGANGGPLRHGAGETSFSRTIRIFWTTLTTVPPTNDSGAPNLGLRIPPRFIPLPLLCCSSNVLEVCRRRRSNRVCKDALDLCFGIKSSSATNSSSTTVNASCHPWELVWRGRESSNFSPNAAWDSFQSSHSSSAQHSLPSNHLTSP